MKKDVKKIVIAYNECINNQDIKGLASLMADDYSFIDTENNIVEGKEGMVLSLNGEFIRIQKIIVAS